MSRIRPWIALVALLGLQGGTLTAADLTRAGASPVVKVRLYAIEPEAAPHLARAAEEANHVFARAGLRVHWLDCTPGPREDPACAEAPGRHDIRMRIVPGMGSQDLGDALGYALPLEGGGGVYATVLFGAVLELRRGTRVSAAQVLGHVMAHELGHLLLENVRHSLNGLMSANWDYEDLQSIARREMRFTKAQTRRIRERAQMRMQAGSAGTALTMAQLQPPADPVHQQ